MAPSSANTPLTGEATCRDGGIALKVLVGKRMTNIYMYMCVRIGNTE